MNMLQLNFPLNMPDFQNYRMALEKSGCESGLRTVPYARRGISLKQLKGLAEGLVETGWLQSVCDKHNEEHEQEIQKENKFMMEPNLYSIDKP